MGQAGATTGRIVSGGVVLGGFVQETSVVRTGSILIIDSDAAIVAVLIEILTDEGYITYAAADGASAYDTIRRHPPALILLDIWTPDLSGAARITALRAVGPAILPIVLMTTAPQAIVPLLVPGSVECLAKPFDLDALLACVARFVQPASVQLSVSA